MGDRDEDEEEEEGRYVDFLDVHWLNDWGHQEPQITWISVSAPTLLLLVCYGEGSRG